MRIWEFQRFMFARYRCPLFILMDHSCSFEVFPLLCCSFTLTSQGISSRCSIDSAVNQQNRSNTHLLFPFTPPPPDLYHHGLYPVPVGDTPRMFSQFAQSHFLDDAPHPIISSQKTYLPIEITLAFCFVRARIFSMFTGISLFLFLGTCYCSWRLFIWYFDLPILNHDIILWNCSPTIKYLIMITLLLIWNIFYCLQNNILNSLFTWRSCSDDWTLFALNFPMTWIYWWIFSVNICTAAVATDRCTLPSAGPLVLTGGRSRFQFLYGRLPALQNSASYTADLAAAGRWQR